METRENNFNSFDALFSSYEQAASSYQVLLAQPALFPAQRTVSNHTAVVANDRLLQ